MIPTIMFLGGYLIGLVIAWVQNDSRELKEERDALKGKLESCERMLALKRNECCVLECKIDKFVEHLQKQEAEIKKVLYADQS